MAEYTRVRNVHERGGKKRGKRGITVCEFGSAVRRRFADDDDTHVHI